MDYILAPFTVIVDSREQAPMTFKGFKADAPHQDKPLLIPLKTKGLATGDYSIEGYENQIACERKSLSDAYSTFGPQNRDRFERELERLNRLEFAAVVVEASWSDAIHRPPSFTKFTPKSFFRSVCAWEVQFPRVRFEFCATRNWAERRTLRWLARYWEVQQRKLKGETA